MNPANLTERSLVNTHDHYRSEFDAFTRNDASRSPEWLEELRSAAITSFTERGFPTTREEDWKFTNIAPIARTPFVHPGVTPSPDGTPGILQQLDLHDGAQRRIVFVDGRYSEALSAIGALPDGVVIGSLAEAVQTHEGILRHHLAKYVTHTATAFTALNTAFLSDGVFIYVPAGTTVEGPVHCLFLSTGAKETPVAVHLRNLIVVEDRASLTVAFDHRSTAENGDLTNIVTEAVLHEGSSMEIVKIQKESDTTFHVDNLRVHQQGKCSVNIFSLALGAAIARNDMSVIIDGDGAECTLNGLYITAGTQLIDHHTFMHHRQPNCPSHELFKGILHGDSRAVFNGKVYVDPIAQKTDSKQTNRNLLLSDTATVDTKPELEIFADDVKCTHGAAVGGLNESHAFYLKSRGIGKENTRGILTVGFAAEVTGTIRHTGLRRHVDAMVVDHLREKIGNSGLPDIVHG